MPQAGRRGRTGCRGRRRADHRRGAVVVHQGQPEPGGFRTFREGLSRAANLRPRRPRRAASRWRRSPSAGSTSTAPWSPTSIAAEAPVEASGKAASEEFVFQQAGERAVSETFRVWPSQLPDTQRGMQALVTDCDLYAADPNDPQRQVPGVTNGLVNIRDALRACAFALAADIDNPRLQFQFGRVLDIAGRYKWAEHFYDLAGKQQYSAALVNLGYHGARRHGPRGRLRPGAGFLHRGRRARQSAGAHQCRHRLYQRPGRARRRRRKASCGIGWRLRAAGRMRSRRWAIPTARASASKRTRSKRRSSMPPRPMPARSTR